MKNTSLAYSIVQVSPDSVRGERVNVGVFVFDLETGEIAHRFTDDFNRVSRLGPKQPEAFLRFALEELRSRVGSEFSRPVPEKSLRKFLNTRSNNLRMSELEPAFGLDAESEAERLFEEFVGTRERKRRETKVAVKLRSALKELGILGRFDQRPEEVPLPRYKIRLRPDLAIRRERYHLIEAVRFDDSEKAVSAAGFHMLAGKAVYETLNMKLVVVGEFGGQPDDFVENIRDDLERSNTSLYRMSDLARFANDYSMSVH